jgi:hypothetical protein
MIELGQLRRSIHLCLETATRLEAEIIVATNCRKLAEISGNRLDRLNAA